MLLQLQSAQASLPLTTCSFQVQRQILKHSRAVIKLEDHSLSHLMHRDKSVIFKDPVAACFVRLRHYSYTSIWMKGQF